MRLQRMRLQLMQVQVMRLQLMRLQLMHVGTVASSAHGLPGTAVHVYAPCTLRLCPFEEGGRGPSVVDGGGRARPGAGCRHGRHTV
jgi:hypothetical protein